MRRRELETLEQKLANQIRDKNNLHQQELNINHNLAGVKEQAFAAGEAEANSIRG